MTEYLGDLHHSPVWIGARPVFQKLTGHGIFIKYILTIPHNPKEMDSYEFRVWSLETHPMLLWLKEQVKEGSDLGAVDYYTWTRDWEIKIYDLPFLQDFLITWFRDDTN